MAIDADAEGLTERLLEANGGGVDVVFDMAGGEVFDASYKALAPFGRIVVYGIALARAERGAHRLAAAPLARGRRLLPVPSLPRSAGAPGCSPRRSRTCSTRPLAGELRPIVGDTYPLSSRRAARRTIDLRARRTTGKLLLDPGASEVS